MKAAAPLFALLLVLSLPAMTVGTASLPADDGTTERSVGADGELIETNETTNRLVLSGEIRSKYTDTGPDLGTVLMTGDDALRADHDLFVLESEFGELNATERADAVDTAFERTEQRIDALEQREQAAVRQHASGEITDRQLLATLVRNYNEAKELSHALDELEGYADRMPGYDSEEIEHTQSTVAVFQSDVRVQLNLALREQPDTGVDDVVIDTAASGISIAMIDGGTYVRETTRFDNRQLDETDNVRGYSIALNRFENQLYPWALSNIDDGATVRQYQNVKLYSMLAFTEQGTIEAYLDGGSENIYHEVQQLQLSELPSTPVNETWTNDSLELSINETPVNGPIEVTVTDETGDPVEATILVDGYELGETDADGQLWLVPPAGEFELTAHTEEGSLNATASPGIDRT